jgi:hypothetical protein
MQHPILLAALADDLGHRCPCGAVTQQTDGLCRGCRTSAAWRQESTQARRCAIPNWARPGAAKARLFATVVSLLQIVSKGAGN